MNINVLSAGFIACPLDPLSISAFVNTLHVVSVDRDPLRTGLQAWVGWLYKHVVWADTLTIHNLSLWLNYLQTVEGCWGAPIWQGWRTLSVPACSEVVCRVGKYQHQCVFRWICWRMLQVLNLASMSSGASVEGCCRFPNSQVCLRVGCLHDWLQDMHKVTVCVCDT